MAVSILETIKSKANAGNTAYIVVLSLLCDTYSDLPTQYGLTGYELAQGCKAHVIDTNTDYMIDSAGTWHIYGGGIWQNVYTKSETDALLDDKQDELDTAQLAAVNSGITAAKLATDEAALAELTAKEQQNENNILRLMSIYEFFPITDKSQESAGNVVNQALLLAPGKYRFTATVTGTGSSQLKFTIGLNGKTVDTHTWSNGSGSPVQISQDYELSQESTWVTLYANAAVSYSNMSLKMMP